MTDKKQIGPQKLKAASIRNFKGVRHVEFTVAETVFRIAGANGSGKTSVIDALKTALSGYKFATEPVRLGERKAEIHVELSDLLVNLVIHTDGKIDPTVIDKASGKKVADGKKTLRTLLGDFELDPWAFLNLPPKDMREALLKVATHSGKPLDLAELDEAYRVATQNWQAAKPLVKERAAVLAANPPVLDAPKAEVDAADLLKQVEVARAHNSRIDSLAGRVEQCSRDSVSAENEVARLEKQLAEARKNLKLKEKAHADAAKALADAGPRQELTGLETQLRGVEDANRKFRSHQRHLEAHKAHEEAEKALNQYADERDDLEASKKELLESATFPAEGLGVTEDGVVYKGRPFKDASTAEKLRVAVNLRLAQGGDMPVVFIDNAETLDPAHEAMLAEDAAKRGATLILGVGSRRDSYELLMEDGQAKK